MTISALSNVQQPQNLFTTACSTRQTSASGSVNDPAPQLSPMAEFLNKLQAMQQQNPAEFKQVTQNIATKLQAAASQATRQGDSARAAALTKLASDFQTASQTGKMPEADQLQADASALKTGHHHHGHHYNPPSTDQLADLLGTTN